MNKHIIYIPNTGQEYVLSQQLAQAFARHSFEQQKKDSDQEQPIIIAQYGSNLKPLELVTPKDTLQIMFTPISNLHAPMHAQTTSHELLSKVPMLVDNLIHDGLNPDGCTIQLYTLEYSEQNNKVMNEIAKQLMEKASIGNFSVEWHVIPRLKDLSHDQLSKIFQPNITCQSTVHAITDKVGNLKLMETKSGMHVKPDSLH